LTLPENLHPTPNFEVCEDIYIEWFYLKGLREKLEEVATENNMDIDG